MPAQTNNLYLLEDLDHASRTKQLAKSDLAALRTVSNWIKSIVVRPHKDLGRDGSVCTFVPGALERKILWLASEHIADRSVPEVVQLMSTYKRQFLQTQPLNGDDANAKVIVVVFTDLPADRAEGIFGDVLKQLAVPSYVEDGILFGPFYVGNKGTAIYNGKSDNVHRSKRSKWESHRHHRGQQCNRASDPSKTFVEIPISFWRARARMSSRN